MQENTLVSYDGTRIAYQVWGESGPWLVVANGYGGTFCAWREVFPDLDDHYRILIWDYRGLFNSEVPADRTHLTIEDNCRDLDALMVAEGIDEMVLIGWSVGVQVALEQYRRRPETIRALILINGSHGRVLHRSLDGRLAARVLPALVGPLETLAPWLEKLVLPFLRAVARPDWSPRLLSVVGIVNGVPDSFHEALERILREDFAVYSRMGRYADGHDAEDLLDQIRVPTLVTSGSRDIITPPRVGRLIASRIPGARYRVIEDGTHYSVMEFPSLVAGIIDEFVSSVCGSPHPRAAPERGQG